LAWVIEGGNQLVGCKCTCFVLFCKLFFATPDSVLKLARQSIGLLVFSQVEQ